MVVEDTMLEVEEMALRAKRMEVGVAGGLEEEEEVSLSRFRFMPLPPAGEVTWASHVFAATTDKMTAVSKDRRWKGKESLHTRCP